MHRINTASGRVIDLDSPKASTIALEDIAGGLSRICRFAAQSVRFHSVAQHAGLVSELVAESGRPDLALAALHHDSHEAYVCDIPAPLKRKLRAAGQHLYEDVCDALDHAIFEALSIPVPADSDLALIKAADETALMLEAAELLPDGGRSINQATGLALQRAGQLGASRLPEPARTEFLARHNSLLGSTDGGPGPAAYVSEPLRGRR